MNLHQFLQYRGYKPGIWNTLQKEGVDWTFEEALAQELEICYELYSNCHGDNYFQGAFLTLSGAKNKFKNVTWTQNGDNSWSGEYRGIKDWYCIRQGTLYP